MKRDRLFEQEYRDRMTQVAPDLWNRIESGLNEHPRRAEAGVPDEEMRKGAGRILTFPRRGLYGAAAAAAAVLVILAGPGLMEKNMGSGSGAESLAGAAAYDGAAPETAAVTEMMEAEDAMPEEMAGGGMFAAAVPEAGEEAPGKMAAGETFAETMPAMLDAMSEETAAEGAFAEPEARLRNTQLLCQATVRQIQYVEAADGQPARYRYEVLVDAVYYEADGGSAGNAGEMQDAEGVQDTGGAQSAGEAQDAGEAQSAGEAQDTAGKKPAGVRTLTVEIPAAGETEPEQNDLQMVQGASYLLPLTRHGDVWEPVLEDVPQIRRNEDGSYLFPDVYRGLADGSRNGTFVEDLVELIRESAKEQ